MSSKKGLAILAGGIAGIVAAKLGGRDAVSSAKEAYRFYKVMQ